MNRPVLALVAAMALVGAAHADEPQPLEPPPAASPAAPEPSPAEANLAVPEPPPAAVPEDSRARQGVYVGVSLLGGASADEAPNSDLVRIRVGVVRSPRLLFGFEGAFVQGFDYHEANYDVGVTFFPWERWFFLRGGVGATVRSSRSTSTFGILEGGTSQGGNLLLGLGCAFTGRRGLNLALNAELLVYSFGYEDPYGRSPYTTSLVWLGLDWY